MAQTGAVSSSGCAAATSGVIAAAILNASRPNSTSKSSSETSPTSLPRSFTMGSRRIALDAAIGLGGAALLFIVFTRGLGLAL